MNWDEAVEQAIKDGRSEELLRKALAAMWEVHNTRCDRKGGPDSYYAGVTRMGAYIRDAVDVRLK